MCMHNIMLPWPLCNNSNICSDVECLADAMTAYMRSKGVACDCKPVALSSEVIGFVMPLTELADHDAMIHLMHALLNFRPKRSIWQPISHHHDVRD